MLVLTALVASADYSPPVLGLAIVKHVLEAHKSVMYVQSLPAQGTAISFTLKK
jgi:signal transduction histidine kinase